jgi:hypothetical protein
VRLAANHHGHVRPLVAQLRHRVPSDTNDVAYLRRVHHSAPQRAMHTLTCILSFCRRKMAFEVAAELAEQVKTWGHNSRSARGAKGM